jgi:hypothetical protein
VQPHGLSPHENVIKECEEEASIPRELAQKAVPAGAVSYFRYCSPVHLSFFFHRYARLHKNSPVLTLIAMMALPHNCCMCLFHLS